MRAPFLVTIASIGATSLAACGSTGPVASERVTEPPMNPPSPDPLALSPVDTCPPSAPTAATPCVGDFQCHYGSDDGCDRTYVDYRCVGGTFELLPRPTCNPPGPPPVEPATSK